MAKHSDIIAYKTELDFLCKKVDELRDGYVKKIKEYYRSIGEGMFMIIVHPNQIGFFMDKVKLIETVNQLIMTNHEFKVVYHRKFRGLDLIDVFEKYPMDELTGGTAT